MPSPSQREIDALNEAQELAFEAWDATTARKRVALAQKAVDKSPLCADGWSILAQHAEPGSDNELDLLNRAVEAGKEALGDSFEEMEGEFWGWMETRPYMRAREALAAALWARGRGREAAEHLDAMLLLNPDDNQGVRYVLVGHLAALGDHAGIERLVGLYPDEDAAMWTWPLALAAFRRKGDGKASRSALEVALESNDNVPPYLLGQKKLPKQEPEFYEIGGDSEAVLYAGESGKDWAATPGALDWLRARVADIGPAKGSKKGARGKQQ